MTNQKERLLKKVLIEVDNSNPWNGNLVDISKELAEQDTKSVKATVEFIESFLVTTVHPEGNMHHIDDKEWESVKQRLCKTNQKIGE